MEKIAGIVWLKFSAPENEEGYIFTGCAIPCKMRYFDEGGEDIIHVNYPQQSRIQEAALQWKPKCVYVICKTNVALSEK